MMDYNRKRRWGTVVIVFIAAVLAAGYAIGDYFVDYALKRGNETDPLAPPAACVNILDKSREMPEEPAVPTEEWRMTMPDGRNVVAVSYRPAKTGHRWVILAHGYGRDHRYVRDYAEVYLKQGYHVLSPDLCAAGESDGQYITMGVKESEEIAKWAAKVKESDGDAEIVLHGISMGAATVMLAAGRYEMPGLAAVVEDCSYTSAYEMFANQLGVIFGLPEFPIMTCVDIVSGIKTGVKVSDAAPIKAVPDIKVPIMFIHGTADKLVPFPMMEKLYNACPAPKRKFVVEGVGHGDAMTVAGKEYWEAVFSFLDDCPGAFTFHCDNGGNIHVGNNFFANYNVTILDNREVRIGDNVMIGPHTLIATVGHPLSPAKRRAHCAIAKPIIIGNDVWIGGNVTIMPGLTIGNNVVIAAGAVVTKDVPDNSLVAGVPAKKVRDLENDV